MNKISKIIGTIFAFILSLAVIYYIYAIYFGLIGSVLSWDINILIYSLAFWIKDANSGATVVKILSFVVSIIPSIMAPILIIWDIDIHPLTQDER